MHLTSIICAFLSRTWISTKGSPKSIIETCTFTYEKTIDQLEFKSFDIAHEKRIRSSEDTKKKEAKKKKKKKSKKDATTSPKQKDAKGQT